MFSMFHNIGISSCLIRVICIFQYINVPPPWVPARGGGARVGARLIPAIILKKSIWRAFFSKCPY